MTREKLQLIVDHVAGILGGKTKPVIIKDTRRGACGKRFIQLPGWIRDQCREYQIYYAVHEAIHIIYSGHGSYFKKHEEEVLAMYSIGIIRRKIYPKRLIDLSTGAIVYERG